MYLDQSGQEIKRGIVVLGGHIGRNLTHRNHIICDIRICDRSICDIRRVSSPVVKDPECNASEGQKHVDEVNNCKSVNNGAHLPDEFRLDQISLFDFNV